VWLRFKPGDDGRARWWVHDLVLETFVGLRPKGMTARYKDRDVMNLSVDNLEWAPRKKE
jgi:hypothetical protein